MGALTRTSSSTLNVAVILKPPCLESLDGKCAAARWRRDHAGVDDPHVANANANAERLRDPPALDSMGNDLTRQRLVASQTGELT